MTLNSGFGVLRIYLEVCFSIPSIGQGSCGPMNDIFVCLVYSDMFLWLLIGLPRMLTWSQREIACSYKKPLGQDFLLDLARD